MDGEHRDESLIEENQLFVILNEIMNQCVFFLSMVELYFRNCRRIATGPRLGSSGVTYNLSVSTRKRIKYLQHLLRLSDEATLIHLRMSRLAFARLQSLVETLGGLKETKNSSTAEQLAMFLMILAHHTKNRVVKSNFKRSRRTVSKSFHQVLNAVLRLHHALLIQPTPVTDECNNGSWKWFKGCLGALDGTYIPVTVSKSESGRYRNRKGQISVNVLAACDMHMNFIYVLSGWEGSAADSRVLRDAVTRTNGLRVPRGTYYLCDNGYTNGEGFLTPYRGVRYHLREWESGNRNPQNKEELFNLRHSRARNVIERAFGLLKNRWAILRSPSFYSKRTQNRIILACCLIHNFIRQNKVVDPLELDEPPYENGEEAHEEYIASVETSNQWTAWREAFATDMYIEWTS